MEITYSTIRQAVLAMRATRELVLTRWDYYRNTVNGQTYFPLLVDETPAEYEKRIRIGVGWAGALANRLATYFRKPPIEVAFEVSGDSDHARAKEASEVWAQIQEQNDYWVFMVDLARDGGVGGNAYTKERIVFHDRLTGAELKTGDWDGQIKIERVNELFMYRIWDGTRTLFVEAWARTALGEYKFLNDLNEDEEKLATTYIEVIAPPLYDEGGTGEILVKSSRTIWKNGALIYGPEVIPYKHPPLQRYANLVSRPESEDGISDIDTAIPLVHAINHTISGTVRSIQYHGWPQMYVSGVEGPQNLQRAPERILFIPPVEGVDRTPEMGVLTWDQNIEGARNLVKDLADMMAAISGVPKHQLHDLEGAGAVVSGVALRLLYRNMNEVCLLKEAGFKRSEQEMVETCLDMLAVHNKKPGYFDEVDVKITYNPDRTPRDQVEQLAEDRALQDLGLIKKVEMVMRHNPEITTEKRALEYLKEIEEEKAALRKIRVEEGNVPEFEPAQALPGDPPRKPGEDEVEDNDPDAAGEGKEGDDDEKE